MQVGTEQLASCLRTQGTQLDGVDGQEWSASHVLLAVHTRMSRSSPAHCGTFHPASFLLSVGYVLILHLELLFRKKDATS